MKNDLAGQELWALFIEATSGTKRVQWMLFPPARTEQGISTVYHLRQRFIKRRLEHSNHRAKWKTTERSQPNLLEEKLALEIEQYKSMDWVFKWPVVIPLDRDDYEKVWGSGGDVATPYKALRHVEAVTKKRGYRLTG